MKSKFFYKKKVKFNFNAILNLADRFKFGSIAFATSSYLILNLKRSLRFVLFIKKIIRRKLRGVRKFWILPGDFFRVSLKSKGARMGKGKGKSSVTLRRIPPYTNYVEFKNVRKGRLSLFCRILNSRSARPLLILLRFNNFYLLNSYLIK